MLYFNYAEEITNTDMCASCGIRKASWSEFAAHSACRQYRRKRVFGFATNIYIAFHLLGIYLSRPFGTCVAVARCCARFGHIIAHRITRQSFGLNKRFVTYAFVSLMFNKYQDDVVPKLWYKY